MEQAFTIDTSIYSQEFVHQAISDFQEVCDASFDEKSGEIVISGDTKEELETCFLELMNYVISL